MAKLDWLTGTLPRVLLILLVTWVVNRLARRAIAAVGHGVGRFGAAGEGIRKLTPSALQATDEHTVRADQRREALISVLKSAATVVIYTFAIFVALNVVGVKLAPLVAGAGVIGVALGFGAQSVVKDILSGVFILFEDQYGIGDHVIFGTGSEQSGKVEWITLRTTRIRAMNGTVWHVPNGEMRIIGNQSQHWSRAVLDLQISYDADVAKAKQLIARAASDARAHNPEILAEPEVWGVQDLNKDGVTLRVAVKTSPSAQWRITRDLRERIKEAFDTAGIRFAGSAADGTES